MIRESDGLRGLTGGVKSWEKGNCRIKKKKTKGKGRWQTNSWGIKAVLEKPAIGPINSQPNISKPALRLGPNRSPPINEDHIKKRVIIYQPSSPSRRPLSIYTKLLGFSISAELNALSQWGGVSNHLSFLAFYGFLISRFIIISSMSIFMNTYK